MSIADVLMTVARLGTCEAAYEFAAAGLPIFPCEAGGKRPLTRAGYLDATRDINAASDWWRRWPQANIGMPTGRLSGIDVVDVDVKGETSGFPMLHRAVDEGLLEGEIARVRTPSGGMHIYFPSTGADPQRCWQAAGAHIDFRGDGGYVIVPPSVAVVQSGVAAYRPFSFSSAPAQPIDAVALREFLEPRPVRQERAAAGPVSGEVLAVWMARLREGERNHGLFWAACRLSESGVIAEAIVEVLGPAAERIGLDAQEVERTVSSACRHTHSARRDGTAPRATNHTPPSASCNEPRGLG
ncbi:bifunctional DNA primase/polymerase [uncultured Microbacterium sp.]|uniref:bifunctional DNA primase/polymerase n=1 Tax=uncultured Microbacterium sp. TaxID=191216 RepID=UPI0028D5025B|nr:bifunctional DNA primase/polymerase [uncultured Microbacterium sp.]